MVTQPRHQSYMDEITIKVPGPFAGVADLGLSARYPEQDPFRPLRDVPLWIEGPAEPMRRLEGRLRLLATLVQAAHGWTHPIVLSDEVVVMAFQDRSGAGPRMDEAIKAVDYVTNLIRPVIFPFLQDCAQVARLRLTDRIEMSVRTADRPVAQLNLRWDQIVPANGEDLLCA